MRSYTLTSFSKKGHCVCALGCFDGVHVGHSSLIKEAIRISDELSVPSLIWSFKEPPKNFFEKNSTPILTTPKEKQETVRALGADIYVSVAFEPSIAALSAEDFFKNILIKKIGAVHIVCGFNYRFGRGGKGDTELLAKLCHENGIGLSVIPPVIINGVTVSSSAIRSYLADGRLNDANMLLGRPYSLTAKVIDGQHLGRTLGFPTVNQKFRAGKLVVRNGVYVSRILLPDNIKYGITNVGFRPTVDGNTLCAETNIFDYKGDLYGKTVKIEFLEFLRPEQKFESIEELSAQVHSDIKEAKAVIEDKYKHS